jgi:hypothetical protein
MELHKKVYKALSEVAVQMATERKTIDEKTIEALKDVLK